MPIRIHAPVAVAAILMLFGCGDSTGVGAGDAEKLVVDPVDLYVSHGDSSSVLVRVVDAAGAAMDASVVVSSVGPGISIVAGDGYPPADDRDGELVFETFNGELKLEVAGLELTRTSFQLAAAGREAGVTVTVLPAGRVPARFSAAELVIGDTLILEVAAPLRFRTDFHLVRSYDRPGCHARSWCAGFRTLALSEDGRRATVLPLEDFSGRVELEGTTLDYAGSLSLRIVPEDGDLNIRPTPRPLTGTGDPATAPAIAMPLPGDTVTVFDEPPESDGSKYYKLEASRSAEFTFRLYPERFGDYEVHLQKEGETEWTWLFSTYWGEGSTALFKGIHYLRVDASCCPDRFLRLDISASPQSP